MSFEDDRTRQVRTGQAINLAIQLAINEFPHAEADDVLARAQQLIPTLAGFIAATQDGAVNTLEEVKAAFPGAEVIQFPQAEAPPVFVRREPEGPVAQAQTYQQAAPQPSPVPGVSDGDPETAALWQEFLADPSKFWDNRQGKRNPKAPDFKHKQNGDKALWLVGKKNPSWVGAQLAARGLA